MDVYIAVFYLTVLALTVCSVPTIVFLGYRVGYSPTRISLREEAGLVSIVGTIVLAMLYAIFGIEIALRLVLGIHLLEPQVPLWLWLSGLGSLGLIFLFVWRLSANERVRRERQPTTAQS